MAKWNDHICKFAEIMQKLIHLSKAGQPWPRRMFGRVAVRTLHRNAAGNDRVVSLCLLGLSCISLQPPPIQNKPGNHPVSKVLTCCAHFDATFFHYCVSLEDCGIAYETKQQFLEQFHKYVDFAHAREDSLLQDLNRDPEQAMSK